MDNQQLLNQLKIAVDGIEFIKQSNEVIKADLAAFKAEFKADIADLKISIGKLETKIEGIDTRLGNEEAISRIALGSVVGGVALTVIKFLFFPS